MAIDLSVLPDEVRALIASQAATILRQQATLDGQAARIEQLRAQLAKLRRMQFGRSSEKLDAAITQLELALEDLEAEQGAQEAATPAAEPPDAPGPAKPARRPLPDHLPRHVVEHVTACSCPFEPAVQRCILLPADQGVELFDDLSGPHQGGDRCFDDGDRDRLRARQRVARRGQQAHHGPGRRDTAQPLDIDLL